MQVPEIEQQAKTSAAFEDPAKLPVEIGLVEEARLSRECSFINLEKKSSKVSVFATPSRMCSGESIRQG
eukprot:g32281.t1